MKITIDTDKQSLGLEKSDGTSKDLALYSNEAFRILSDLWLKVNWTQKYTYTFSWMGRPIIQLPEDMIRTQEVIYRLKPDVILETGVAHGGSLIYYASLCRTIGKGRIIGVDIEIRPHNRDAIEKHEVFPLITLIEGGSTDPAIVDQVKSLISPSETVLVLLDSDHSKKHVEAELEAYHELVTPGSYIVVTDGIMRDVHDSPRGKKEWLHDNPVAAAEVFTAAHKEFVIEQPEWPFNESDLTENITHWPSAWLHRL